MLISGCKKKLYKCRPHQGPREIEAQVSRARTKTLPCDPKSLERGVRQALAVKVSGDLAGLWLLTAEHLRLGTWDLLCGWTGRSGEYVEPRLALQLVHEAAVCTAGIRAKRTLQNRGGFELANGLPFVAGDVAIHELLNSRSIADCQQLQVGLGKLRRASGHFKGKLLAIDPHRTKSHSQRRMRERVERKGNRPTKQAQTFWVLDADTHQPVCFTTATASRNVVQVTPDLLALAQQILQPSSETMVLADAEHFSGELVHDVKQRTSFDMLVPLPSREKFLRSYREIPESQFTRHWAGYATAKKTYELASGGNYWKLIERIGERNDDWSFKGFLSTTDSDEMELLTQGYPKRWHIEEFFNAHQALGWKRAGTQNLHIRYGQMTAALVAQAVIHGLRERLGEPYRDWDATHLSTDLLFALDGDVRVQHDTILVTYYNAPNAENLRSHYEGLPARLESEGISPAIPWLYGFKLDFRFR